MSTTRQYSDSSLSNSRILVIDDTESNILLVEGLLAWAGFQNVMSVKDPRLALRAVEEFHPDIVLLDLHMPHVDGFEILSYLQGMEDALGFMPILVFTADSAAEAKSRALALGASDFLTKPGDPSEIIQRVRNFLRARRMHVALEEQMRSLDEKVRERTAELEEARIEIFESLSRAVEYRDDETGEHTRRVGQLSRDIAVSMGLEGELTELIRFAAQLHDLGKIGIPDHILLKPGRLTPEEFDVMRQHAEIGGNILRTSKSPLLKMAREIAIHHHENWDGSGYPAGIRGENVPLCARIVAVADVFDALTHQRPYKPAWPEERAYDEIRKLSGSKFDPAVVDAFFHCRSAGETRSIAA